MAKINVRMTQKQDSLQNWQKATGFIPMKGELFLVNDYGFPIVIGDGETSASELSKHPLIAMGKGEMNNIAGAKAFKVIAIVDKGNGVGKYHLSSLDGLEVGMRYVSVLSIANYIGGNITAIDTANNTITVDGYVHYSLNANTDNPSAGNIYNYLMIVNHPELGDTEVGYHAVAFGDNTQVYAVGAFGAGRNNKVLGKFGAGFGGSNEIGHATLGGGTNNKFRGSSNLGGGTNNVVDSHGNLIGGTLHNLPLILDETGEDNGRNIVGGKQNYVGGRHNIVGGMSHRVEGSESSVSGYHQVVHSNAWRVNVGGANNTVGENGGLSDIHGNKNISNGRAVFQRGENNDSSNYSHIVQLGVGHVATANNQIILGKYANPSTNAIFTVGNGNSTDKSNAFEVLNNGDIIINNVNFNSDEINMLKEIIGLQSFELMEYNEDLGELETFEAYYYFKDWVWNDFVQSRYNIGNKFMIDEFGDYGTPGDVWFEKNRTLHEVYDWMGIRQHYDDAISNVDEGKVVI